MKMLPRLKAMSIGPTHLAKSRSTTGVTSLASATTNEHGSISSKTNSRRMATIGGQWSLIFCLRARIHSSIVSSLALDIR
jgi:hypothetical protein